MFSIVRKISSGEKRVAGKKVLTLEAIVNFGSEEEPELATRHLQSAGGGPWKGRNSDRTRRERATILKSHVANQDIVRAAEMRLIAFQTKFDGVKGKRGVVEERKKLLEVIKIAKVDSIASKTNLERVAEIVDRIDETHPEFVQFLA